MWLAEHARVLLFAGERNGGHLRNSGGSGALDLGVDVALLEDRSTAGVELQPIAVGRLRWHADGRHDRQLLSRSGHRFRDVAAGDSHRTRGVRSILQKETTA